MSEPTAATASEATPAPTTAPAAAPAAKPPPKAEAKAAPKPTDDDRTREEQRRSIANARAAEARAKESTRETADLRKQLEAHTAKGAELRALAQKDPAKAIQEALGITYAEATKKLLAMGRPDPNAQTKSDVQKLQERLDAEIAKRETLERAQGERANSEATENIYQRCVAFASAPERGDKYELVAHEAKADPATYRRHFRSWLDTKRKEIGDKADDLTEDDLLADFEEALLTRERKRVSLSKLRGLYGPGSTTRQPVAKSGASIGDVPRTLTQDQTSERASSREVVKNPRALEREAEEDRIRRAADALSRR